KFSRFCVPVVAIAVLVLAITGENRSAVSFTAIDFPGAVCTMATGINNQGQIIGIYANPGGACGLFAGNSVHGFLLSSSGFSTIDFPGASSTYLYGINDSPQIVGSRNPSRGGGFVYDHGTFTPLNLPVNPSDSETKQYSDYWATVGPMGINNNGQ